MRTSLFKTFIMLLSFLLINNTVSAGHPPGLPEDWFRLSKAAVPSYDRNTNEYREALRTARWAEALRIQWQKVYFQRRTSEGLPPLLEVREKLIRAIGVLQEVDRGKAYFQLGLLTSIQGSMKHGSSHVSKKALAYYSHAYELGGIYWFRYCFALSPAWINGIFDKYDAREARIRALQSRADKAAKDHREKQEEDEIKAAEKAAKRERRKKGAVEKRRETIKNQVIWATDLLEMVKLIDGAEDTLPRSSSTIQHIREQVADKQRWRSLNLAIKEAEKTYYSLLNQITQIAADAAREKSKSESPLRAGELVVSVVDLATASTDETRQIKIRVSKETAEREAKYAAARLAKKERREELQGSVGPAEAERTVAQELAEDIDVPMSFAIGKRRGKGGQDAARLFQSHGGEDLTAHIERGAAHMLSVFAYSKGPVSLIRNLSDIGMASHGLNYEKLSDGRQSIRVNNRYRICFNWDKEQKQWTDVWYGDYH